jgi:hypothetical protein
MRSGRCTQSSVLQKRISQSITSAKYATNDKDGDADCELPRRNVLFAIPYAAHEKSDRGTRHAHARIARAIVRQHQHFTGTPQRRTEGLQRKLHFVQKQDSTVIYRDGHFREGVRVRIAFDIVESSHQVARRAKLLEDRVTQASGALDELVRHTDIEQALGLHPFFFDVVSVCVTFGRKNRLCVRGRKLSSYSSSPLQFRHLYPLRRCVNLRSNLARNGKAHLRAR